MRLMSIFMALTLFSFMPLANAASTELRFKFTGAEKGEYLHINNHTGLNILAGVQGFRFQFFHVPDQINTVALSDINTLRVYPQTVPASCKVNITGNETVTMHGQIIKSKDNVIIKNLRCTVN